MLSTFPVAVILAAAAALSPALADPGRDATEQAHEAWRADMARIGTQEPGCFHAEYPSETWVRTECQTVVPRVAPRASKAAAAAIGATGQTAGDGNDYVIQGSGQITSTVGSFPQTINVTSEQSVGVPSFGNFGILGPNEYTLQINSNFNGKTAACRAGSLRCTVWQQFVYSPDYVEAGSAAVFMQYWLINYGDVCPAGYIAGGRRDCFTNSDGMFIADEPITELANMKLSGTATAGGNDTVTFIHGTEATMVAAADNVLDLAQVWRQSEFNIVGDGGGSEAIFNDSSSVTVNIAITDGTSNLPSCLPNLGTTAESNNFTLGVCTATAGSTPSVEFTEFIGSPPSPPPPVPTVEISPVPTLGIWGLLGAALMLGGVGYSVVRRQAA